jgi:hypothetical protein
VSLELDRKRHRRQDRDWCQRHRYRQPTGARFGHRKRAQHPEQTSDEHRQQRHAMVLGVQRREVARTQADPRRRLDPHRVGHLHKYVDQPDRYRDADHDANRDQQLVQPRIECEKDVHAFAQTRRKLLLAGANRLRQAMISGCCRHPARASSLHP